MMGVGREIGRSAFGRVDWRGAGLQLFMLSLSEDGLNHRH